MSLHTLHSKLAQSLPVFKAKGNALELVESPKEFFDLLKRKILSARRRIFISSLYIGKEEKELISTVHRALSTNPSLRLTILLDYLRGTREHPQPSSASLVSTLSAAFPERVDLRLYHTPTLRGPLRRLVGKRYNEGWGLQHMKVYGFDEDVIVSGANLSHDYFTNRLDRYMHFPSHGALSDYLSSLVSTVSRFSYSLHGRSTSSSSRPEFDLRWSADPVFEGREENWEDRAAEEVRSLTREWHTRTSVAGEKADGLAKTEEDTTVVPLLQMGPIGIDQETQHLPLLFDLADTMSEANKDGNEKARLDLTSGYFSLFKPYKARVLDGSSDVKIVAAAPESNGFFNSRGISYYIPPAYTYLERRFYDEIVRRGQEHRVELREWKKEGWTYHAKGFWLSPPGATGKDDCSPLPTHTLIGSSNYGARSARRDLECSLLISTSSSGLRARLGKEVERIRESTEEVDRSTFEREDRRIALGVKVGTWLIKDML